MNKIVDKMWTRRVLIKVLIRRTQVKSGSCRGANQWACLSKVESLSSLSSAAVYRTLSFDLNHVQTSNGKAHALGSACRTRSESSLELHRHLALRSQFAKLRQVPKAYQTSTGRDAQTNVRAGRRSFPPGFLAISVEGHIYLLPFRDICLSILLECPATLCFDCDDIRFRNANITLPLRQ